MKQYIKFVFCGIILLLILNNAASAQVSLGRKWMADNDSVTTPFALPNPFLKQELQLPQSTGQKIMGWVFQNRLRISSQFTLHREKSQVESLANLSSIDWTLSTPGHGVRDLDYRESSLFVPENVHEYMDFKMGRTRILPVATLAGAAYLAYQIYNRYGYLLRKREREKYLGLTMSPVEIELMKILWESPGISAAVLYSKATAKTMDVNYLVINNELKVMENKCLVNSREMTDHQILYFPAISLADLKLKLKAESANLDGIESGQRLKEIREILTALEE